MSFIALALGTVGAMVVSFGVAYFSNYPAEPPVKENVKKVEKVEKNFQLGPPKKFEHTYEKYDYVMTSIKYLLDVLKKDSADGRCDIETEAFLASGCPSTEELKNYTDTLEMICQDISAKKFEAPGYEDSLINKAKCIHDYIFERTPNPYLSKTYTFLSVIHGLYHKKSNYANCAGLTALYTILCNRFGIEAGIVFTKSKNHVLSLVKGEKGDVFVENTSAKGFDIGWCKDYEVRYEVNKRNLHELMWLFAKHNNSVANKETKK